MTMFARITRSEPDDPDAKPDHQGDAGSMRLTPDGHEVAAGAVAQGFPQTWPELRVQAIYESVEPDTFRGQVLCDGVVLGSTGVTELEPEAIRWAEDLVGEALGRLFRPG